MSNHVHPKRASENAAQCPDIRGQNSRASEKMCLSCGWWIKYEDTKSPWRSPALPRHWPAFLERLDELTRRKGWAGDFRKDSWLSEMRQESLPVDSLSSHRPRHMVWPWCHLTWVDMLRPEAVKQILDSDGSWEDLVMWGPCECGVTFSGRVLSPIPSLGGGEEFNSKIVRSCYYISPPKTLLF